MNDPLLRVNLQASYAGRSVLHDVRFELQAREVLGLVGTSGAGKSTLVLSLMGLLPWRGGRAAGEVMIDERNLLELPERELRRLRGREIALIPQSPMSALNPAISLRRHFHWAWKAHGQGERTMPIGRLESLMDEVQLPSADDFLDRRPSQISVGQAQRVLIALALIHQPKLIIADEPTSALDAVTQNQIIDLLNRLNRQHGTTILYISHDLVSVVQLCDRLAVLDGGTIVETLAVTDLQQASHPVTRALLGALPAPTGVLLEHRRRSISEAHRLPPRRIMEVSYQPRTSACLIPCPRNNCSQVRQGKSMPAAR